VRRLLSDPRVYAAWLAALAAALFVAHATDPYVFGFAVFALGGATGGICLAGLFFVVWNPGASRWARWTVSAALLIAVAVVLGALAMLGSFRWA
jgi:hypothetical protein